MKTTVDIPDKVLKEAMKHSKAATKRQAVIAALEDYNQRHRQAGLIKYLGTFKDFITPAELSESRSSRMKRHGVGWQFKLGRGVTRVGQSRCQAPR